MNRPLGLLALALLLAVFTSCSALRAGAGNDLHTVMSGGSYTLAVKTDVPELDPILYEMAAKELEPLLPIGGQGKVAGAVSVAFSVKKVLSDPNVGYSVGSAVGTWGTSPGDPAASKATRTYLDGMLSVEVRDSSDKVLWSAKYQHKGRFSLSVTPDEVARLCLKGIASKLRSEMANQGISPRGKVTP